MTEYRMCKRCVMDTSDPEITFDEQGVCNHCHTYDRLVREHVLEGEAGRKNLSRWSLKFVKTDAENNTIVLLA